MSQKNIVFTAKLYIVPENDGGADIVFGDTSNDMLPIELFMPDSGTQVFDNDVSIWDALVAYNNDLTEFKAGNTYDVTLSVPVTLKNQIKIGMDLNFGYSADKNNVQYGTLEILGIK